MIRKTYFDIIFPLCKLVESSHTKHTTHSGSQIGTAVVHKLPKTSLVNFN